VGGNALEDNRDLRQALDPVDVLPVEARLVDARVARADAAALVALGDVALAPRIAVRIDRQRERVVAAIHRAADMIVDPSLVAADIKLEDFEPIAGRLGGFFEPRMRDRA